MMHKPCHLQEVTCSVATVMTDAFRKNRIIMMRKLGKTVRIFVEIEHIKNWGGSYFDPKELDQYFPQYGAVTSLVKICD